MGIAYHGCKCCQLPDDVLKTGVANSDAMRLTEKRLELLKLHPDVQRVVTMKSCQWSKEKKNNPAVTEFLKGHKLDQCERRLSLKMTFRGGLVS